MDELYLLEQEEALRRAEYETRHAEALRRAESQSRQSQVAPSAFYPHPRRYRLSKSATTSPIMTNALALGSAPVSEPSSVFPLSTDRCSSSTENTRPSSNRRLSGPAWPSPHQQKVSPLIQSRSSGHLVDSMRASTFNHHHGTWTHPYQSHQNQRQEAAIGRTDASHVQQHEDSPSPISSDSEPLGHDGLHKTQSPSKMFHLRGPSASQSRTCAHMHNRSLDNYSPPLYSSSAVPSDFEFTPSTSPFLGPMRTLNIHSATPSRAPSPIFLPPGHGDEAAWLPLSHSRAGSVAYGSPPLTSNSFVHRKQQHRRGDGHPGSSPHYGCAPSQLPTPQLSCGPSSCGSSCGSFVHGPPHSHGQHQLGETTGGSGTLSASHSRAPSPILWGRRPSPTASASASTSFHHTSNNNNSHTHHLAHSVRTDLGMTPIYSHSPSGRTSPPPPPPSMPRNTSWSASPGSGSWHGLLSNQHQHHDPSHSMYNHQLQRGANPSLPGSRSGSPPIRLPPLKMLPSTDACTATISNLTPHSSSNSHPLFMEDPTENPIDSGSTDQPQQQTLRVKKEKVELPGFSEFEAATRATGATGGLNTASSSAPTAMGADARMSIDFVRWTWCRIWYLRSGLGPLDLSASATSPPPSPTCHLQVATI